MKNIPSPQQYIDWGLYSMFSASLGRRVYMGDVKRMHANQYIVFVGPPGIGKGNVTEEITRVLTHPKLKKSAANEEAEKLIHELNTVLHAAKMNDSKLRNMLIPLSPNATNFEALCRTFGECSRHIKIPTGKTSEDGKPIVRLEAYCALYAILEELGSLVRERTQDVHVLLQETYDCRSHYEYKTKHQGIDFIQRPCFNLLAGATSDFMKRAYASTLLGEGFSSRTVFVVGHKARTRSYEISEFSEEQKESFEAIVDHIAKLAVFQGKLEFSEDARAFNKHWYEVEYMNGVPNPSPRLIHYYSRIVIHHMKMSMVKHCLTNDPATNTTISLETAKDALLTLQENEKSMHLALGIEQKNPYSELKDSVLHYITHHKTVTKKQLIVEFYDSCPTGKPYEDIEEIIRILKDAGNLEDVPDGRANVYVLKEPEKQIIV